MKQNFIEDNIQIISKQTMDLFLSQKNPADLIALYMFYYYTAKWQDTNQPKASTKYVSIGLGWGEKKTRDRKKDLIELGIIEEIKRVNKKTKKIKGWYIKLNYIWKQSTEAKINGKSHPSTFPQGGLPHRVDYDTPNALSVNSLNASNANKETFEKFWELYQKKVDRYKCELAWNKIKSETQKLILENAPLYKQAHPTKKYRKNPLTYLNGRCWEDEITQNKSIIIRK